MGGVGGMGGVRGCKLALLVLIWGFYDSSDAILVYKVKSRVCQRCFEAQGFVATKKMFKTSA